MCALRIIENMPLPYYGAGLKWNEERAQQFINSLSYFSSCKLVPDHFFCGKNEGVLKKIQEAGLPALLHPLDLALGSLRPLPRDYVEQIRDLGDKVNAVGLANILGKEQVEGQWTPLPWTLEMVDRVCKKIEFVQKKINLPFLIGNVADCFLYSCDARSELSEVQFLNLILNRTGCYLLLDLRNIYLNATREKADPYEWIDQIEITQVAAIDLKSGFYPSRKDTLVDGHPPGVWELFSYLGQKICPSMVFVEEKVSGEGRRAEEILESHWGLPCQ